MPQVTQQADAKHSHSSTLTGADKFIC